MIVALLRSRVAEPPRQTTRRVVMPRHLPRRYLPDPNVLRKHKALRPLGNLLERIDIWESLRGCERVLAHRGRAPLAGPSPEAMDPLVSDAAMERVFERPHRPRAKRAFEEGLRGRTLRHGRRFC
jgi:hypothetical protein